MNTEPATEPVCPFEIEDLVESYLEDIRNGSASSIGSYKERHPQLAKEIDELFPLVAAMEGWKDQETAANGGRSSLGGVMIERLGDFRMVREIGRGGMGIVYEAVQESLKRSVAIKILPPGNAHASDAGERFRREAQLSAGLHHSNIVPVFGIGSENGFNYIVMQLIDGCGLDKMFRAQGSFSTKSRQFAITEVLTPSNLSFQGHRSRVSQESNVESDINPLLQTVDQRLDPRMVAKLGVQAAAAIHYAHINGILHRDIKPANLLLDKKGHLWVADFGLAKALEHQTLSRSSDIVGTLLYMAPERLRGKCDARSDVYSLGITLLELVTGRPVFEPKDSGTLIERITSGYSPRRGAIESALPRDLITILTKSISLDPKDRYQTAEAFNLDLQAFLDDRPIQARRTTRIEAFRRLCRKNPVVTSLSAGVVSLLFLTVILTTAGLIQQRKMRNRTEATLNTTLRSLDKIYNNFAISSTDAAESLVSGAVLSDETAAMLTELLAVYDELASQGGNTDQLRRESINAQLRVAEIQTRLGRLEYAKEYYERAIAAIESLRFQDGAEKTEWLLKRATACLSLASTLELTGEPQQASNLRQLSLVTLESLQQRPVTSDEQVKNDEVALAIARAHYLEGKANHQFSVGDYERLFVRNRITGRVGGLRHDPPRGPQGPNRSDGPRGRFGPPMHHWPNIPFGDAVPSELDKSASQSVLATKEIDVAELTDEQREDRERRQLALRTALDGLATISNESPLSHQADFLRALTLSELSRYESGTDPQSQTIAESLMLLQELVERFPDNAEYQLQLARTLMQAVERQSTYRLENVVLSEGYLSRAVQILSTLHNRQPQIPEYAATLAQVSEMLGLVSKGLADRGAPHERGARMLKAEELLRDAIGLQEARIAAGHDSWLDFLWLYRYQTSFTLIAAGRMEPHEAKQRLDEIRAALLRLEVPQESQAWVQAMITSLTTAEVDGPMGRRGPGPKQPGPH